MAVWPSDNGSSHINKVTVCRARLVLRCVTTYPYTTSVYNYQKLRLTQPPTLSGKGNEYWSTDTGSALRWEGNRRSDFAPAERHRICHISTYRLNGLRKGNEHPTYTSVRCIALYYFTLFSAKLLTENRFQCHIVNHSLKIDSSAQSFSAPFSLR